jgi:hypothetical protein
VSDQDDIDSAAEHQHMLEQRQRREATGWEWWPAYHDEVVARRRAESEQIKALNWALDRIFRG